MAVQGDQVCRDREAEEQRTLEPSPGTEGGGVGSRASTHLGAPVHKEDGGVLLPRLHGMRLVDHAVQAHVRPRVEVEELRGHVIRGAACGDRAAVLLRWEPTAADTRTPLPGPQPRRHPVLCFTCESEGRSDAAPCGCRASSSSP